MTRCTAGGQEPVTRKYRWRAIRSDGSFFAGAIEMTPAALPEFVKSLYDKEYRELLVCTGPGPNPPRSDEHPVAEIYQHPDTGHRAWYAEQDGAQP